MKITVLTTITLVFATSFIFAQETTMKNLKGGGNVIVGLHQIDFSELNGGLKNNGLPVFDQVQTEISAGIGGGAFINRLYFGGAGFGQFGSSVSDDLYEIDHISGYGMVQGGYALVLTSDLAFYPTIGLGGGGQRIMVDSQKKETGTTGNDNKMHSGYMVLDFGINSDFFPGKNKNGESQIFLGVSAGYQWHPFSTTWTFEGRELTGFEKFTPSGFYVKFKLGYGNF